MRALKSDRDFEKALLEIKFSGEREIIKVKKTRELTQRFWTKNVRGQCDHISDRLVRNMQTLYEYTGRKCTPKNISDYMCMGTPEDLMKFFEEGFRIASIRSAVLMAEFYRLPVEMIMFQDIKAIYEKEEFRKQYAFIIRQD